MENKKRNIGIIFVVFLLFAVSGFGALSFAEGETREEIVFTHLSPGAGGDLNEDLDDRYEGTFTEEASIGDYKVDISTRHTHEDGCYLEPSVQYQGEDVDPYGFEDGIVTEPGLSNIPDNDEFTHKDFEFEFASPHYMDNGDCQGVLNRYTWDLQTEDVDLSINAPEEATEDRTFEVEYEFENDLGVALKTNIYSVFCMRGVCNTVEKKRCPCTGER